MKKAKRLIFSRKYYFPCGCSSLKSFINYKHVCVEFDCEPIFPAEINALQEDFPDL